MIIDPEAIRERLEQTRTESSRTCPPLPGIRSSQTLPAAVLMPMVLDGDTWKFLFIKRTHHRKDRHSGQIAFPGGRSDPKDPSLAYTALREAKEEIGVNPEDIHLLGQSCSITTVTDYEISPYAGILPWPYGLELSKEEVEKTLLIPIDWLADPKNYQTKTWASRSHGGAKIPVVYFNQFAGETLWGATAQIVVDFLALIQSGS